MKKYVILLFILTTNLFAYSQTNLFSVIQEPATLDNSQMAVKNYALNAPRIGGIQFVQFAQTSNIEQNGQIKLTIPSVNENQQLVFQITNAIFDDATHYSIQGKNSLGYLNLYFTPEGTGGTIDLINRLFTILPIGESKGILFENNMSSPETSICASNSISPFPNEETDFCEGDCGAATLDLLVLIAPEANTWLNANFGWLSGWFLFMECNNINVAFINSAIPGKRVRVSFSNFTPDFTWSTNQSIDLRVNEDTVLIANSQVVRNLRNKFRADIVIVLTNNNYTGFYSNGTFGTIFGIASTLDPLGTNKACIAQVNTIGPVRYTLAHEVAHQFGCMHSIVNPFVGCPHGTNMAIGRNTIVANNAGDNTRIPHYSNPDVDFGGEATGVVDIRDNAQQIRAAFCESANNNTISTYSADFFQYGAICPGQPVNFISNVSSGLCEALLGNLEPCGVAPYQYEWTLSPFANFSWSIIVGTNSTLQINPICPVFYLRLKVTSSDGMVITTTNMFKCSNCLQGGGDDRQGYSNSSKANFQVMPNPAFDEVKIFASNVSEIKNIECFTLQGVRISLPFSMEEMTNSVVVSVHSLNSGMYVFRINGEDYVETVKVIVNK